MDAVDLRVAWVLNLDADFELGFGLNYAPTKSVQNATKRAAQALVGTLTGKNHLVIDEAIKLGAARGLTGRAFCPTPRALALLERAGAIPEAHPSFEILQRVNSRAFCQSLGATMPHATFETDLASAEKKLRSDPIIADSWRVKRSHGVAGRGQRIVRPHEDISFLKSWAGVQIEPNVAIDEELGLHATLSRDGDFEVGAVVVQTCDAAGAWIQSTRVENHPRFESLFEQVTIVARALHAEKYFGPFGIDAFEYRDRNGVRAFQPRSEINARYSMGFALGFDR